MPSFIAALRNQLYRLAGLDTFAILGIGVLYRSPLLPYRRHAAAYCTILYLLAVGLLVWVGPVSQIYLFGFSIFTTLLLGLRPGLAAVFVSSATLFAIGSLGFAAPGMLVQTDKDDLGIRVVITLN